MKTRNAIKTQNKLAVNGVLFLTMAFLALSLGIPSPVRADDSQSCSNATLKGTYVYAYSGYADTGRTLTRFAVAGLDVFRGDGTLSSVYSITATEGQPIARLVTSQGKYNVNSNCTVTEIDTDPNGNVFHYDDFTDPSGRTVSFVETDPNVVSSGTETRK